MSYAKEIEGEDGKSKTEVRERDVLIGKSSEREGDGNSFILRKLLGRSRGIDNPKG